MPKNNKPYYLIMTKNTSLNLMGGSEIYTSPKCEVLNLAMDTAVCQASGTFSADDLSDGLNDWFI